MPTISKTLARASHERGGQPLLTHYGLDDGERTELSVASFANWVDKTANLLDALGIDEDSLVALPVLDAHPAHWMGLVWAFALWQRGVTARVVNIDLASDANLAVIGPDAPQPVALDTFACSLHPWGLPLTNLPDGVTDFSSEAMAQPDVHIAVRPDGDSPAWVDPSRRIPFSELAGLEPIGRRVAASPDKAWDAVSLVARAVLGGGSVVLIEGSTGDVTRILESENAELLA